ncbi:hypothetical protein BB558_002372 [Smittium angustum]|uniref:DNA mismatch repair protein n=1 Tax=Smittium angustum TaxID=133377 RepID=A0A2U1J549_SMIAN|nr:hypothetical protein BB558_003773 [Smittium angustum]PWA01534.1 hypothetical protein BB558_002372 [Smittium angustum]
MSSQSTPKKNNPGKIHQQSLLSFFGTPKTKTSTPKKSASIQNTTKDTLTSALPTDLHLLSLNSEKQQDTAPPQKSRFFGSSFNKSSSSQSKDSNIKINPKSIQLTSSFEFSQEETLNDLDPSKNSTAPTNKNESHLKKQKDLASSIFDDSDSFDFEVDQDLLDQIEKAEKPINSNPIQTPRKRKAATKTYKLELSSDSDPFIDDSGSDANFSDNIATESEDDYPDLPESSDNEDIYTSSNTKKTKTPSKSKSFKKPIKQRKIYSSDNENATNSDKMDVDITHKKLPSLQSESSGIPLMMYMHKEPKENSSTINRNVSLLSKTESESGTSMDSTSLLERFNKNSQKDPKKQSNFDRFKLNGSGIKKSQDSKPAFDINYNHKQQRAKEFTEKNKERYKWLLDIRDGNGKRPGEPGYDSRTLFIPKNEWQRFTPFELQYWEIKSKNWDTVVFFKKGKFYELFENDADIGHQQFDLKLVDRVNMRMVGVPEMSFEHWATQFVAKGYKVAKVEQMESSLAKTMRERDGTDLSIASKDSTQSKSTNAKTDKVVKRELTCILTAGTLVDPKMLAGDLASYCMAIVETSSLIGEDGIPTSDGVSYGIAFVDTATAKFYVVGIENDDINRTQLETLLVQINPKEAVFVSGGSSPSFVSSSSSDGFTRYRDTGDGMGGLTQATWKVLRNTCGISTLWNGLIPNETFWNFKTTCSELKSNLYFGEKESLGNSIKNNQSNMAYPPVLEELEKSSIGKLVLTAVGGLVSYLRSLKLDRELVSLGNFEIYTPLRNKLSLMLDGSTLSNLDVFTVNGQTNFSQRNSSEGTLFHLVNHTLTPFGRRLIYQWVCHPLCDPVAINSRLDIVEYYLKNKNSNFFQDVEPSISKLPDLERLLSRVHTGSCRIPEWLRLIDSLTELNKNFISIKSSYLKNNDSTIPLKIKQILNSYPEIEAKSTLESFQKSFDWDKAKSENVLVPFPGSYPHVDSIGKKLHEIDEWLQEHLEYHRKLYKTNSIVYKSIGKELHQLEIPRKITVPHNYMRKSATKDVHRYYSPELNKKLMEQAELKELLNAALRDYKLVLFRRWGEQYRMWMQVVQIISEIDALFSLAKASEKMGVDSTRPEILTSSGQDSSGYIEFRNLKHPCLIDNMSSSFSDMSNGFVPNDIVLGSNPNKENEDEASVILLSGPNMGGKSTLIRQVCVAIVLAQLGCYVPATKAKMTVFSRIFTRLGAKDNLLLGRSTFMVEMAETATFLQLATKNCFVAVDELGRGTSTHDGEAVAFSVLHTLASRIGCLSIFSTHYGLLANDLCGPKVTKSIDDGSSIDDDSISMAGDLQNIEDGKWLPSIPTAPHIRPMHMACLVDQEAHRVTFLYKLKYGIAARSHGMNVAHMAGVPLDIVKRAEQVAIEFEHNSSILKRKNNEKISEEMDVDYEKKQLPINVLSDFANLIRVSKIELEGTNAKSSNSSGGFDRVGSKNSSNELFSVSSLSDPNYENQNWSCVVNHITKTVGEWK